MLQELHIRNYAIIEAAEMQLNPHLNVIIGETGAGKSILMGALSLVLGNRADTQVLMDKEEKCVVEAHMQISSYALEDFFEDNDLEYADTTIIRREINPKGKSRAFINDTPVTLEVLKSLTSQLIDIHAQHENSQLLDETFFIQILDKISKNPLLAEYQVAFNKYSEAKRKLRKFQDEAAAFSKEYEFIKYQFEELDQVPLSVEYWKEVEEEVNILSNAGTILQNVQQSLNLLSEDEINVEDILGEVQKLLSSISALHSDLDETFREIEDIQLKIRGISRIFKSIQGKIDSDEERLNELNAYQSAVNRMMQKHQFKEVDGLIRLHTELKEKLQQFSFSEDHIQDLEAEISEAFQELADIGSKITELRKSQALKFGQAVTDVVKVLGMPFAKVEIQMESLSQPDKLGFDKVTLLFAPNKGSQLQSLLQVGSGGEKSRLMLAIKSLIAKETALPTLIFDEIDTGISGEVAIKTGELLQQISINHQVVTITHLPQVAAAGKQHFLVYKEHLEDKSITNIKSLDRDGAIHEIAKMLSGASPTAAAIENAKNLIAGAKK